MCSYLGITVDVVRRRILVISDVTWQLSPGRMRACLHLNTLGSEGIRSHNQDGGKGIRSSAMTRTSRDFENYRAKSGVPARLVFVRDALAARCGHVCCRPSLANKQKGAWSWT